MGVKFISLVPQDCGATMKLDDLIRIEDNFANPFHH